MPTHDESHHRCDAMDTAIADLRAAMLRQTQALIETLKSATRDGDENLLRFGQLETLPEEGCPSAMAQADAAAPAPDGLMRLAPRARVLYAELKAAAARAGRGA